jgi:hypothetical protein
LLERGNQKEPFVELFLTNLQTGGMEKVQTL